MADSTTASMDASMDFGTFAEGASGGGGTSGDMPPMSLNNAFSGHVIFTVPDTMTNPDTLDYSEVWNAAKAQHPILNDIPNSVIVGSVDSMTMTVLKVEFYGASAGIITLQPYIQRPPFFHQYLPALTPATQHFRVRGQQMIDVGTITRKPYLSHTFGNSVNNTRYVNDLPEDTENTNRDLLVEFQYQQKAATPVPVDTGYLRVSFICRKADFLNLSTIGPVPPPPPLKAIDVNRKRAHEMDTMSKIDKIKRLTMPVLDSANPQ